MTDHPADQDALGHEEDPYSRRSLRFRQLLDAIHSGDGFIVRDLETGEIVEVTEPTVGPETKLGAGEAGLN